MYKNWLILLMLWSSMGLVPQIGATETSTTELSLEDLLQLDVDLATLTGMTRAKVPVSVTTITKEDIALTPARHILDLIEIYVPGAFWEGHSEMGHPGIRGVIADRNGKVLLLVNGRRMNQDAHAGAVSEIENYDLRDIERIEVIRGPGSVTYGPGAIMGVINIVTKQAQDNEGWRAYSFANAQYRQNGSALSYGYQQGKYQAFAYFSAIRTLGQKNTRMFSAFDSVLGFVGSDIYEQRVFMHDTLKDGRIRPIGIREANNYMGDYWNTPQIKAMLDLSAGSEHRFMARYTNSGNSQILTLGNPSKIQFVGENSLDNSNSIRIRQYMFSYENIHEFNSTFQIQSIATWNDQDYRRAILRDTSKLNLLSNYTHNFSEKRWSLSSLGRLTPVDGYKFALGAEYARTRIAAPWFQNSKMLRLGDAQNMFGDTTIANPAIYRGDGASPAGYVKKGSEIYVGEGWETGTVSFVAEANLEFHRLATMILSGRADKNDHSTWGISPRIAWISEINDEWIAKLIAQRSVRMNFMEHSWIENERDSISDPEVFEGIEGILHWTPSMEFSHGISGYYNRYDVLGFSRMDSVTRRVGDLELLGVEWESKYTTNTFTVGLNHSYLRQMDYSLAEKQTQSGISYSDFKPLLIVKNGSRVDSVVIQGYGNHLNNWPSQASKLFVNWQVMKPLTLHLDARIFWAFEGGKDGLEVYDRNADALPVEDSLLTQKVHEVIDSLRSHEMYEMDFRLNTSLSYAFSKTGTLTVYCQNLLGFNENKRYPYDAGDIRLYSTRWQYVSEPRTIGANLEIQIE